MSAAIINIKEVFIVKKTSIGKLLRRRREELDNMCRDRIAKLAKILEISPLVIMGA